MKTITVCQITLFVLTTILFVQCNNDDDLNSGNGPLVGNCQITWTLDGVAETYEPTTCLFADSTLVLALADDPIFLQLNQIDGTGQYEFASSTTDAILFINTADGTQLVAESGSINLMQISNSRAKGTFTATMRDITDFLLNGPTFEVTNGQFEADF